MVFLDGSQSFVNGFAMGQLWENLKQGPDTHSITINGSAQDQALMIAAKMDYAITRMESLGDDWFAIDMELRKEGVSLPGKN